MAITVLGAAEARSSDATDPNAVIEEGVRAERLGTLGGSAQEVLLLPEGGPDSWPADLRRDLEERVIAEWDESLEYGVVEPGVGARLQYPLVTARMGARVIVPVVEGHELPVRGELDLLFGLAQRRLALLVDTSSSTNAQQGRSGGVADRPFHAEWEAVERVYQVAAREPIDISVIAFGHRARAVVPPDTPVEDATAAVARYRKANPRGHGRTDSVCALWMGREWLEQAPDDVEKHLVILTDGAEPDSGRFPGCRLAKKIGGGAAEWVCRLTRNRSECPAEHELDPKDGASDWDQVENFAEELPEEIHLHALLFGPGNDLERYELFADRAAGRSRTVLGPAAIDEALLDVVGHEVLGVYAMNETNGEQTRDILGRDGRGFEGVLSLDSGANDIILRVEKTDGTTLFRFRVYAEPELRRDYLTDVRKANQALERERAGLIGEAARDMSGPKSRDLTVTPD